MLIKNLPTQKLRVRAEQLRSELSRKLGTTYLDSAFCWDNTEEGHSFWLACYYGDWEKAAKLQPKYFDEE